MATKVVEEEEMLRRLDEIKREQDALTKERAEIETYFKNRIGDDEQMSVGAYDIYYKYIDAVGTINEDALRADYPKEYLACAVTKIDVRKLVLEYPAVYNAVLISGSPQRRFSYKVDITKLVKATEKRTKRAAVKGVAK